jgi:hypothetical protein
VEHMRPTTMVKIDVEGFETVLAVACASVISSNSMVQGRVTATMRMPSLGRFEGVLYIQVRSHHS